MQQLIYNADVAYVRSGHGFPDVTPEEYRKALRPIKAFRTRSGIAFDIEEV